MMMCPASNLHRFIVHYIFNELIDQVDSANNVGSESTRIDVNYITKTKNYKSYVEPDVFIGKDLLWKGEYLVSAPELVIEVLNFATANEDKTRKLELYKKIGVKEYLLVSQDKIVTFYNLNNENYAEGTLVNNKFESKELDIILDFDKIFGLVDKKFK